MNWTNIIVTALFIIVAIGIVAGSSAGFAILFQILRQGGWKLAEPAVIRSRWRMVRLWMLAGAVIGLFLGIAILFLSGIEPTPPAAPNNGITSPPPAIKSRPEPGH